MNKIEVINKIIAFGGIDELYRPFLSRGTMEMLEDTLEAIAKSRTAPPPGHLSFTQVNMFRRCSLSYYFRYVEGIKLPPGYAMTQGRSIEAAIDHNYRQKIETGKDEPLDVLEDVYHEDFKAARDETDFRDVKPEDIENEGRNAVAAHWQNIAPKTHPRAVQKEYNVKFTNRDYTFKGFIDLIAVEQDIENKDVDVVIDNKHTKQVIHQADADASEQLTGYAGLFQALNGHRPPVGLDVIQSKKTGAEAYAVRTYRTTKSIDRWWRDMDRVYRAITMGAWVATPRQAGNRENWVCTEKWCGYWERCMREF